MVLLISPSGQVEASREALSSQIVQAGGVGAGISQFICPEWVREGSSF